MKTTAIIAAVILLVNAGAMPAAIRAQENTGAGGQWQGTPPLANASSAVANLDLPHFLALNTGGTGGSFGQGDLRFSLNSLSFLDRTTGWAAGAAGAFKTNDGGLTWQRAQPRPTRPGKGIGYYHIRMTGRDEVWLLEGAHPGGPGKAWLWRTRNDGKTWEEELPGKLNGYRDLCAHGRQLWLIGNRPPLWTTHDGGANWSENSCGSLLTAFWRMAVPDQPPTGGREVIYILGATAKRWPAGQLIRTTDGGQTWRLLTFPDDQPQAFHRYQLFFLSPYRGWLGLPGGRILRTDDGGESWTAVNLPPTEKNTDISALWFDQLGRGFVATVNHDLRAALYYSPNAGESWTPVQTGQKQVNALFGLGPAAAGAFWAAGNVPGNINNDLLLILDNNPPAVK